MKLLQIISSLDPKIGGPPEIVRTLTPVVASLGHEVTCVTLDAPRSLPHDILPSARTEFLGPRYGSYGYAPRLIPWLKDHGVLFDAVLVHGLWQYQTMAARRALQSRGVPYFVYPHGMLDPWFNRTYPLKHLKKLIYWNLFEQSVLKNAAAVLFTCDEERRLARTSFPRYHCTEETTAFGTARPPAESASQRTALLERLPALRAKPFYLYLSRIHEKKGIDLLLQTYGNLARSTSSGPPAPSPGRASASVPALVIAGPCVHPGLLDRLKSLARSLPAPCEVYWPGMLQGDAKWGALRSAELFILPSHQENFGIAVAEAMACGTPVAITNKVNIWREIEADGAGLVENDDLPGITRLLERWTSLDESARTAMRHAALATFDRRYEIKQVAQSLMETIGRHLGTGDGGR